MLTRPLTRRQRLNHNGKKHDFAICCVSVGLDVNIQLMFRNLACFGGADFYVIGNNTWQKEAKGATNGLMDFYQPKYFSNFIDFLDFNRKNKQYDLVAIEQCSRSKRIYDVEKYPNKPCFMFGSESVGMCDDVLLQVPLIVEIPMEGPHICLNVSMCSGIILYDYFNKNLNHV